MATRTSTEVHLKARPDGIPDEGCFRFVETEVPDAGHGEVLVRNVYMSVDPAMRPPLTNGQQKLDHVLGGSAIGRVEQSQNPAFAVGDFVQSRRGWREYFSCDGQGLQVTENEGALGHHVHGEAKLGNHAQRLTCHVQAPLDRHV